METVFNNVGKPLVCSGIFKQGHNVQPNSVSLMCNLRLQLVSKCQKCGVLCTKIRRRQNDFLKNNEKSFSDYFYVAYDAKEVAYKGSFYF